MRLSLNGLEHNIETWGDPSKPQLFLFHGWLDMGASFDFVCRHLEDHFYCIALDFRGMGQSQHTANPLGYFFYEYIADLHALFQHFSPDTPVQALGHSMGGNVVALYAGTFPERVSQFINIEGFGIVDMPSEKGPHRLRAWIEGLGSKTFNEYARLEDLAARLRKTYPRLSPEKALFLAEHLSRRTKDGFRVSADPKHKYVHPYIFQLENIVPFWQQIQARCLLVSTEHTNMHDWMTDGADYRDELKKRLAFFPAGSPQVVIKDSGHMVHHDQPEDIARITKEFLTKESLIEGE